MEASTQIQDRMHQIIDAMTVRQVATAVDMSVSTVGNYLAGRAPSVQFIERFCVAFGVSSDWLLFGRGTAPMSDQEANARTLPGRLHALRADRTTEEFSQSVGIAASRLRHYCNGEHEPPASALRQIASQAGVSADWLLGIERTDTHIHCLVRRYETGTTEDQAYIDAKIGQTFPPSWVSPEGGE